MSRVSRTQNIRGAIRSRVKDRIVVRIGHGDRLDYDRFHEVSGIRVIRHRSAPLSIQDTRSGPADCAGTTSESCDRRIYLVGIQMAAVSSPYDEHPPSR
jgi:hypothetical protein